VSAAERSQVNKIQFQIDIAVERDGEGFRACCPALKGLHVGGDTEEQAIANAMDAAIAYLASLMKHGDPIPLGVAVNMKRHAVPSRPVRVSVDCVHPKPQRVASLATA
jgi:predicted RNase H-like HicB family nuclease